MGKIKGFFSGALGAGIFLGFIILSGVTLAFGIRVVEFIYPFVLHATTITTILIVLILLPLAIFRKTRSISVVGLMIASYIFGASLWLYSFLVTYTFWGIFGLVIAFFMLGIGVTPVAIVAALFHWNWGVIANILYGIFLTFGSRLLAIHLEERLQKKATFQAQSIIEGTVLESDSEYLSLSAEAPLAVENIDVDRTLYCGKCGQMLGKDSKYCKVCGNKI